MRRILRTFFLVLAVMVLFVWAIIPPDKQLRLGKDLAGGVSMTYAVQVAPGEDAKEVLDRTIDTLKRRVDPDGVMDIAMTAQGRDRIEMSMPLPNDKVKKLRAEYQDALKLLGTTTLTESGLDEVMRQGAALRSEKIDKLSESNPKRKELLRALASAYDRAEELNQRYQATTDAAAKDALVAEVATAQIAYATARDAVMATALSVAEVRKVVESSTRERYIDDKDGRVKLPSAREVAEKQIFAKHPENRAEIERLLSLHAAYAKERTTLDDPNDLIRMLRGAGVLSFRITVRPGSHPEEARLREELRTLGPRNVKSTDVRWYRINQIENWLNTKVQADMLAADPANIAVVLGQIGYVAESYAGDYYMLAYDTRTTRLTQADGEWAVSGAFQGVDQRSRPAVNFMMNQSGAKKLGALTSSHLQEQMGVLLDDEVYTAPTLQGEITSNGQITGEFPKEEIDYIVRVLAGGSLQAKLSSEPISVNAVGPELGADNLRMGFTSAIYSVIIVAVFMCIYYFFYGFVAVFALLCNAVLIVGAMALSKAAFTMPGIAGVILTFGMAVDSNVLVYERIREELNRGNDLKTSVRLGFDKALSAIVDGNVTNLIVCVVLYYTGTPEIRGFAITMGIGVVCTLFAALVISRLVFDALVAFGWKRSSVLPTSMLPMAIPKLQSWLTPNVDWIRLRYVFFAFSAAYVLLGLGMILFQGSRMLDNEFRGGTQVTLQFKPTAADPQKRVTLERPEVVARVEQIATNAPEGDLLRALKSVEVIPVDPQADGVTSDRFIIKTTALNTGNVVLDSIRGAFAEQLESSPALNFTLSDMNDARQAPAYPIEKPLLGANVDKPGLLRDVTEYMGGVALVLENIQPATTLESLRARLDTARQGEQFSDTLSRKRDILVVEGGDTNVTSAVVVIADESTSVFENEQRWESDVRDREWSLVQEALTRDSTPASVLTFSPSIADTFRANAITATVLSFVFIGIYIWIRFKTPRYSIAAVIALVHDVLTVVGFVALAEILYESAATHQMAVSLGLLPFKIDLNMVAALLTIAGYSLNDTVVIMDRIRENRGKLPYATREIINTSINQTFSRTLITGGTTLGSCFILYVWGGEGMRAFAFALAVGLIVGTYSSVAVAAPIVWSREAEKKMRKDVGLAPATT
jgi:SecD/SecF fusion protein